MGDMVEFQSNGNNARGYLATPGQGAAPGVIVVQEWWGLNSQIKSVCDRLVEEGFTALARRGQVAARVVAVALELHHVAHARRR